MRASQAGAGKRRCILRLSFCASLLCFLRAGFLRGWRPAWLTLSHKRQVFFPDKPVSPHFFSGQSLCADHRSKSGQATREMPTKKPVGKSTQNQWANQEMPTEKSVGISAQNQ